MHVSNPTFTSEDAFYLTGRGLVLVGPINSDIKAGQRLFFADDKWFEIKSVEHINRRNQNQLAVIGLLLNTSITSRDEAVVQGLVGTTAQILP